MTDDTTTTDGHMTAEDDHPCLWSREDGAWSTECGHLHCFFDGGPEENDYEFCPYCGSVIREVE